MNFTERGHMLAVSLAGLFSLGVMLLSPSLEHQALMLFLFVLPVPLMIFGRRPFCALIQAESFACPALLRISDTLFLIGAVVTVAATVMGHSANKVGLVVAALAIQMNALALVVTFHLKRRQAPLMAWSLYIFSATLMMILPIVLLSALMTRDGSAWIPSWLIAPPLIYLYLLPCVGIVCEILDRHSSQRFLGRESTVVAFAATGWFAFFTAIGQGVFGLQNETLATLINLFTLIPFSIILLNVIVTLAYGRWSLESPFLFAIVFMGIYITGYCSGIFLSIPGLSHYLQGTWWTQAHLAWVTAGGAGIAYLAGFYGWWAELGGDEKYSDSWARCSLVILIGTMILSLSPTLLLGALGIPLHIAAPTAFASALRVFSMEAALFLMVGYILSLTNLIVHAGKLRPLVLLVALVSLTSIGTATPSTSTLASPEYPEDLGPAQLDVSAYPPEHQKTYQDVFLYFAKYAGGTARLINSPLIEMDPQSERVERQNNPGLFSEPGIAEVSATAWKSHVAKIRNRPPCCGACPYLTLTQARDLWSFLVYDSKVRKTGPQAAAWIKLRRQLIKEFELKRQISPKEPQS